MRINRIALRNLQFLLLFLTLSYISSSCSSSTIEDHIEDVFDADALEGNYGASLKTAWSKQLKTLHKYQTYTPGLWNAYYTTDVRPDGFVDDIYGGPTTKYVHGRDQQVSGGSSGKYEREHSFPKSWWSSPSSDKSDMYTDLYHVLPCDRDGNAARSNHPFGEVASNENWNNGYCKRGTMTAAGFGSFTVFEPNDEIKGDLARVYFYFAMRYERETLNSWGSSGGKMLSLTPYPFFNSWALNLLMKWHEQDPVSIRERIRNDEVGAIQNNRNPFVDYPELVEYIWGDKKHDKFYFEDTALGKEIL